MSSDVSAKLQVVLWWITSIAVSVLCCSILFVLFASYLVDVKASVRESDERLSLIEMRQNRILGELQLIRRHAVFHSSENAQPVPVGAANGVAPMDAGMAKSASPEVLALPVAQPVENMGVSQAPIIDTSGKK